MLQALFYFTTTLTSVSVTVVSRNFSLSLVIFHKLIFFDINFLCLIIFVLLRNFHNTAFESLIVLANLCLVQRTSWTSCQILVKLLHTEDNCIRLLVDLGLLLLHNYSKLAMQPVWVMRHPFYKQDHHLTNLMSVYYQNDWYF